MRTNPQRKCNNIQGEEKDDRLSKALDKINAKPEYKKDDKKRKT